MSTPIRRAVQGGASLAALLLAAGALSPAFAQDAAVSTMQASAAGLAQDATAQPAPAPASQNATVNLVRLLVAKGVLSQADADQLIAQSESEAAQARAVAQQVSGPTAGAGAALPTAAPGSVRVAYVPQVVRDQIKEEVKQEVIAEAKDQHWIAPNILPAWVNRITWAGDFRFRYQDDLLSDTNTDGFVDYNSFNASGPIDINPGTSPGGAPQFPLLNTRRDRLNQLRIRARLSLLAAVNDHVDVGVRLATGSDSSPVSTNQTLGGGLNKKAIWLDQAFVNLRPIDGATLTLGRMPNPWLSTDLVYDDDLNFDGAALSYATKAVTANGMGLRAVAGVFPIEYGATNFPTASIDKAGTDAKWLYGAQLEGDWRTDRFNWRTAAAVYDFDGVQGQLSAPCDLSQGNKQCSSDQTRPAFLQKGNSLFLIRNILPNPSNPINYAQPQFVGLVEDFTLLDLNTQFDWNINGRQHLILQGDYVKNLAYSAADACRYYPVATAITNVLEGTDAAGTPVPDPCAPAPAGGTAAKFQSGDTGWMVRATFGNPRTLEPGQWNISAGYRYLQPDAVLDAFTDSDFHLGGTNAKGYFIAGQLGIYRNTWITARWLSANAIYGPPLNIDVAQLDLNIGF